MIRPARFQDVPAIYDMMVEAHARSKYKDVADVDRKEAKSFIMNAIQRHGLKREGGTCVFVPEMVDGFIVGILDRIYVVGTKLLAQDVFFYARETSQPQDRLGLLGAYIEWAEGIPDVVAIRNGITDFCGDYKNVEALYLRCGFSPCGVLMERTTK